MAQCAKKYGPTFEHTKRLEKRIGIIEGELKMILDGEKAEAEAAKAAAEEPQARESIQRRLTINKAKVPPAEKQLDEMERSG